MTIACLSGYVRGVVSVARPATGLVAAVCFWASSAHARPSLRQECEALSPEESAQVETRLLASLLAPEASEVSVSITCDNGIARASASVGPEETRRSVSLAGPLGPEAILALATRAVAQLLATTDDRPATAPPTDIAPIPASPVSAVSPLPATTPQTATPNAIPAEPSRPCSPCRASARNESRARADIALQSWGSKAALGAVLGLEQQTESWSYAFLAGGARPVEQLSLSTATEWTAAGELGWQAPSSLGIRISGRLGLSLLMLSPESGVTSTSGTLKAAGFLDLDLSRPLWLGRFGLAPALGLRIYSAKRAVTLEGETELQISPPSVHVGLALLFRISD